MWRLCDYAVLVQAAVQPTAVLPPRWSFNCQGELSHPDGAVRCLLCCTESWACGRTALVCVSVSASTSV